MKINKPAALSALKAPFVVLLLVLALVLLGVASVISGVAAVVLLPLAPFAGYIVAKVKADKATRREAARKGWEAMQKMMQEAIAAHAKAYGANVPDYYRFNEEMGWVENNQGVDWPLTRSKRKDLGLPVHEQDPDTASAATV
jgi:NAD/NADP transhydrogenase alpha subunit